MNRSQLRDPRYWNRWASAGALGRFPRTAQYFDVGDVRILSVLTHELTDLVLNEALYNWTQGGDYDRPHPFLKAILLELTTTVAQKIFSGAPPCPDFSAKWKEGISDDVYKLLGFPKFKREQIPILVDALRYAFGDTTEKFEKGMWDYSFMKICHTVGCVAFMVYHGLPPDLLRMSQEEANAAILAQAEAFAKVRPNGVIYLDPATDTVEDMLTEIAIRITPPDISGLLPKHE